MAEQGKGWVPPGHRAARLVILGALLAALAAGVAAPAMAGLARGTWDQAAQVVAYFLAPLRGGAEPVPPTTPTPTPARPKPKPTPSRTR
ncbi:hypothetical protein ACPFP2_05575 [Micromonospora citrea]|uniref:hypothetical protein n=1 Tax=Micromonospora citrea TaxID=47855 RepID=UPI003C3C3C70